VNNRQYLCLACMKFWFVWELVSQRFQTGKGYVDLNCCPECKKKDKTVFVGRHKERGKSLDVDTLPFLEFIATKMLRLVEKSKDLYGDLQITDSDVKKLQYLKEESGNAIL